MSTWERDDATLPAPPRDAAIRQLVLDEIAASPVRTRTRRRRRFAIWGGVGILVVAAAGTGAGVALNARPVATSKVVHCLSSVHRGVGGAYPDKSASVAHSGAARVDDAIALCAAMWKQGVFEPGYHPDSDKNTPGDTPPDLTVCVMKDGSAAVVPSETAGICQSIGLAPLKG